MEYSDFETKLRRKDPDAVRMLVRAHGAEMLARARSVSGAGRRSVRRTVTRAVRDTLARLDAEPDGFTGAQALIDALDAALLAGAKRVRARRQRTVFALLCLAAAGALWMNAGILMSMGWLPYADIGYTWFNETFFTLF